ncbi:alpha/beta fold hydrolase [Rhizobium rhizogenes]|uniref:Alpha/beta hydrolase n=1 Tax=Rhizobium rhizogenes TaxID=359 RepID=A0AA92H9X7_RHIRH|nr:alpha/beta fold hydrolase [Rhizobium rhizogenes]PVE55112.1 alpha/beta hydrolase [Rhizobium rhizogenes]PVE67665.1 alpha/beta hydrolase [Agrobacterium tumefaciens]PVE77442.1 alpha/beta hydrolase [Sphingomonas sp. TPD3009]
MNAGFASSQMSVSTQQISVDHPVTFANTVGLYKPADVSLSREGADTAVLFVSSWGFEELCARKFWRLLAGDLATRGLSSMRFDYPGTGDAIDPVDYDKGLDLWLDSLRAAAAKLRELSQTRQLILIGHGLGALLAWKAAETMDNVVGLALAAPALSGRHWLREFVALSRVANPDALQHRAQASGPAMGEQVFPDSLAASLRTIAISSSTSVPAPSILLLKQENRPADEQFATHLAALDTELRSVVFPGYNNFVRDVLFSVPSLKAIEMLSGWAADIATKQGGKTAMLQQEASVQGLSPQPLAGDGYQERPVRFGDHKRLYGIMCEPLGQRQGATVIVAPTGYERMSGWGRISAQMCRELARQGIASLRFDGANVADSPPAAGAPEQILYHASQLTDVMAAVDFLEAENQLPVVVTGRCSGAWVAFKSAVKDPRIKGCVPVNLYDLYIPADVDVNLFLRSTRQSLSGYGSKFMSGALWKRVMRGEVRVVSGLSNLFKALVGKAFSFLTPLSVKYPYFSERARSLSRDFGKLAENYTRVTLVYSEGDAGFGMLERNFCWRGRLLRGPYGTPKIVTIPKADHNLTTAEAREAWTLELKTLALQLPPKH